jgi:methyltransferase (TIGR00027 family)
MRRLVSRHRFTNPDVSRGEFMDAGRPSATAMAVAVSRGSHRADDEPPWVLDDPYALMLAGPAWPDIRASDEAVFAEPVRRQSRSSIVVRSRYAEDRLLAGCHRQYVILGAGLDSFAWRRPGLLGPMRVFEVDHPATQAWKRARADDLGLPIGEGHIFVPVDFEAEPLEAALNQARLDWSQPVFFSWLGVIIYLTTGAVEATLRTIAACAPGSEAVLSYDASAPFLDETAREMVKTESEMVAAAGEPYRLTFSPAEAETLVTRCGLAVAEHLTPDDLYERYFSGRPDGLRPSTAERLMAARVPG